ncbi:hypothetical protein D3C76_1496700 [compost metagenome]
MAQSNGPTVTVHAGVVVGQPQLPQHGEPLAGKGFVKLDDIHVFHFQAGQLENLAGRRNGSHAHNPRGDAGSCGAQHLRTGFQSVCFAGSRIG